jgi:hypothetical protein
MRARWSIKAATLLFPMTARSRLLIGRYIHIVKWLLPGELARRRTTTHQWQIGSAAKIIGER